MVEHTLKQRRHQKIIIFSTVLRIADDCTIGRRRSIRIDNDPCQDQNNCEDWILKIHYYLITYYYHRCVC